MQPMGPVRKRKAESKAAEQGDEIEKSEQSRSSVLSVATDNSEPQAANGVASAKVRAFCLRL